MNILICNDDGYLAQGIRTLAKVTAEFANVRVVAPERDRSAVSNSLTLDRPLSINQAENGFYYVDGTPTDCVHLGLYALPDFVPDMVFSGINHGANMGDDTLYSGTVAAATEGYLFGIPAIAFSQAEYGWVNLDAAARVARDIVERRFDELQKPYLLNVNIPAIPYEQLQGMAATRLGKRHSAEPVIRALDPRGREIFWIGPVGATREAGPGTDFHAVAQGQVSITPLQIDLTHVTQLDALSKGLA